MEKEKNSTRNSSSRPFQLLNSLSRDQHDQIYPESMSCVGVEHVEINYPIKSDFTPKANPVPSFLKSIIICPLNRVSNYLIIYDSH